MVGSHQEQDAFAALFEIGLAEPGQTPVGSQVQIEVVMPTLLRATFGSLEHVHAGIGDNHVYTSEGTDRIFDEAFQLLRIRHIRGAVERAYALLFYHLAESLHARVVRRLARTACHMGARPCELPGDAQPDSRTETPVTRTTLSL